MMPNDVNCDQSDLNCDQSDWMPAPTLNSCSALFPRDHARSDDPEQDDGPDTTQPPAEPPIHPFTGTFADSEQTVAFRSKVFRMMMPLHIVAMALMICADLFVLLSQSTSDASLASNASLWATEVVTAVCLVLGLGARIAVHRWEDKAMAQQLGAMVWTVASVTVATVTNVLFGVAVVSTEDAHGNAFCQYSGLPATPLIAALFALVNATHGMEFWHTTMLASLVLCDFVACRIVCGDFLVANLAIVLLVVVHAFCHFNTLLSRHAFLVTDYLHTSRERLEYDFQRLECGMHRLEARLPAVVRKAAGGSAPTESSESTSTAPGRVPRSTQSAPAAVVGGGRPAPEDGRHNQGRRPSVMRCAGAAQPYAGSSTTGHASEAPSTSYDATMPPTPLSRLARRCRWSAETLDRADTASSQSSSNPSNFTRDRKMRKKIRQLRRDIKKAEESAQDTAIRRCPYI